VEIQTFQIPHPCGCHLQITQETACEQRVFIIGVKMAAPYLALAEAQPVDHEVC